jgi:hypothetical protein
MGDTQDAPLRIDLFGSPKQKSSEPPVLFQPTKDRFDLDRPLGTHFFSTRRLQIVIGNLFHLLQFDPNVKPALVFGLSAGMFHRTFLAIRAFLDTSVTHIPVTADTLFCEKIAQFMRLRTDILIFFCQVSEILRSIRVVLL